MHIVHFTSFWFVDLYIISHFFHILRWKVSVFLLLLLLLPGRLVPKLQQHNCECVCTRSFFLENKTETEINHLVVGLVWFGLVGLTAWGIYVFALLARGIIVMSEKINNISFNHSYFKWFSHFSFSFLFMWSFLSLWKLISVEAFNLGTGVEQVRK